MPRKTRGTDNRVLRLCALLNRHRVAYLLAGGVAANLHGSVRATKDIDVLVPKDLRNMEKLLSALSRLPYGIAKEIDPAEIVNRPITIIGDDPRVDILTVAWKVTYDQAKRNRRIRVIDRIRVPFLSLKDLIRSKQSGRPQDEADLDVLKRKA